MTTNNNNKKLPSLRKRYLNLATMVIVLLLSGAGTASWYINSITSNNLSALVLNKSITTTVQNLRHTLSLINMTVNAMLITPESSHEVIINKNLDQALQSIESLKSDSSPETTELNQSINNLYILFSELSTKTKHLTQQRKDPDWVYPALPYISKKLLLPNNIFISSVETGIYGYHNEQLSIDETYHQLHELRNLWQKKVLNFRAVLIRFAGLNNTKITPQEITIDTLQIEIDNLLGKLKEKAKRDTLELHVESSLSIMTTASKEWGTHWKAVKKIRSDNDWRKDITYLKQYILPLQESINSTMRDLENSEHNWSLIQIKNLSNAAQKIITELWLLTLLAISFVIIVYILIEKLVLLPVNQLTKSLTSGLNDNHSHIEDKSSKEIYQLTSAYNTMHKQIHQRQIALEHQAMHDALTNLPNRILFNDRLTQAISIMQRSNKQLAVLLLDLDRFKDVNDTLGHHVGDQLLQQASIRLQSTVRSSDTVARLGGDEFAIIAPQTTTEEALGFSAKIIDALSDVFTIEQNNIYVGVSIGISIFPTNGTDQHTLVRHADTAMYCSKEQKRGAVLYSKSQDKNTPDSLSLVNDLHRAVEQSKELSISYQPQIDLLTNDVIQVEALLRWEHPKQGLIATEETINLAEKTGVIQQLTTWVLNTAIEEYMRYLFEKNISLSINLSTWNLQDPQLPITIKKLLSHHKMPTHKLTLEITETAMMHDPARARSVLNDLSEMGIVLAIDDYGTGFSSLSYLKLLPVHELKIDKTFISEMLENENDAIIVKSTIELAHNLGYKVTAEGVENQKTLKQLKEHNCDTAQGYFISRPLGIHQLVVWLMKHHP